MAYFEKISVECKAKFAILNEAVGGRQTTKHRKGW